jgi:hypothetical protein
MLLAKSSCVVCLLALAGNALLEEKTEPKIEAKETVENVKVFVKLSQLKALLEDDSRELWIAVIPVLQPDTAYIQVGPVDDEGERVVYVGVENKQVDEKFKIVLISAPTGAISKDGAMKVAALKKLGYKRHASVEVHRTK